MIDVNKISKVDLDAISKPFIKIATEFLQDPKNQKDYEEWHLKKYGEYPTEASYMKDGK